MPLKMHFDPIAMITTKNEVVAAYGLAAIDLLRLKSDLHNLNKYGFLLVDRKDDHYRFLVFDEIVVCIFPGFKEVVDETGLTCGFDFQLKDISKTTDYYWLSRWITLKETERLEAENRWKLASSRLQKTRVGAVLGPESMRIIVDLMWVTDTFEPLHAIAILGKTDPLSLEISSLENSLSTIKAGLRYVPGSNNRILNRSKSTITLMDCAEYLFPGNDYFEVETSELSKILGMPAYKLPSHFRGYLIVDDDYVNRLRRATVRETKEDV